MHSYSRIAVPALALSALGGCALLGLLSEATHAEVLDLAVQRELALSGEAPVTTPPYTPYGTVMSRHNGKRTWFHFSDAADFFEAEPGRADLFVYNPGSFTTPNGTLLRYGVPAEYLEPNAYQNLDYVYGFDAAQDHVLVAGKEDNEDPDRADIVVVFTPDHASVDHDIQFVFPATVAAVNAMFAAQGIPVHFDSFEEIAAFPDPEIAEIALFLLDDAAAGRSLFDYCTDYCADPNDLWLMILADSTTRPTYSFQYLVLVGAADQREAVEESLAAQGLYVGALDISDEEYAAQTQEYIFESYLPDGELDL